MEVVPAFMIILRFWYRRYMATLYINASGGYYDSDKLICVNSSLQTKYII